VISCSLAPARAAHCIDKSKKTIVCMCSATLCMFVQCCGGNKFVTVVIKCRMCLIVCYCKAIIVSDIFSAEQIVDMI